MSLWPPKTHVPPSPRAALALLVGLALCAAAAPAVAGKAPNRVQKLEAREDGGRTVVTIHGTATPTFTVYKLERPERVVIDLANAELGMSLDGPITLDTWAVGQLAAQPLGEADAPLTRVIVTMSRPSTYAVKAVGNDVQVTVTSRDPKPAGVVDPTAKKEAESARAEAEKARAEAAAAKADAARAKQEAESERARAEAKLAEADRRAQAAEQARADADRRAKAAEDQRAQAQSAQRDAESARKRAESEAKAADQAARAAASKAAKAEASHADDAAARRAEAEAAARAAEARRAEAEKKRSQAEAAVAEAERKKADADAAKAAAEREKQQLVADAQAAKAARDEAEQQKKAALAARDRADGERAAAEKQKKIAEEARAAEEAREAAVAAKRSEEEQRVKAAADARAAEEDAARAASERRKAAEAARAEAEQKTRALEARRDEAERARQVAAAGKKDADAARAEMARVEAASGKASEEYKRAQARAQAAEQRASKADGELQAKKQALGEAEAQAAAARESREQALAEAKRAKAAAGDAESARKSEEARKAELQQQRKDEEQKLADARKRRQAEEARLASAERARKEAEAKAAKATPAPTPAPVVAVAPAPAPRAAGKTVRVANVDYVDRDDRARVVIALSGETQPEIVSMGGRQAILSIPAADIPAQLERSLDVSEFQGPVTAVSSYRDPREPSRVRVVVDLAQPIKGTLSHTGNTWYLDFARPAAQVAARKPAAPARAVAYEPPVVGGYGAASTPVTAQTVAQKKKVYRGKRVELDFRETDIHNLLRLLARVGDVDIVIPDDVKAKVTIRMTDVPWDQALEVILQSKGLWYRREGRIIRIAERKVLDEEDEQERKRRAALVEQEQPEAVIFTLNYSVAEEVKDQAKALLSPKGTIEVDERTNSLIISDLSGNRSRIIRLLTDLDTQTPQIQIEARVVEARSNWSREIGVQWGIGALASAGSGNPTGLIFPSTIGVGGGAVDQITPAGGITGNPNFAVNLPATVATGQGGAIGFTFGSVGGNFNLTLRLSAAEESGYVRIISAPKISALNNVKASISQGVSIPIQVVSNNGAQTQFVDANLKLEVTPHVSQRDCSIQLDVFVQKNEPDFVNTGARGDPSILKKEAKTVMLVADGETTVIGGIYTRNTGHNESKVPFLGDIPILGYFFRNKRDTDDRSEVLIFITPKITNKGSLRCETSR